PAGRRRPASHAGRDREARPLRGRGRRPRVVGPPQCGRRVSGVRGVDYTQRWWDDVDEGQELARIEDLITYRRVVMNAATTWDYFPGHHDPGYARSQGQPTIYVNTMHFQGFIDRVATTWAGPLAFIVRRRMAM